MNLLQLNSMESILDYINRGIPKLMMHERIAIVITRAMGFDDISFKWKSYQIQDSIRWELRDISRLSRISSSEPFTYRSKLEVAIAEKEYLIEQLTISRAKCLVLEEKCIQLDNHIQHMKLLQGSK